MLEGPLFCPDCGTRNPGENRFCGMCGERLPDRTERGVAGEPSSAAITAPVTAPSVNSVYEERRDTYQASEPPAGSSPSFLGLGSADYEPREREISWRFWALMLVLLGVVALFGLQWRAHRMNANPAKPEPGVTEPAVTEPTSQASPGDNAQQPDGATAPASSTPAAASGEPEHPEDKGKGAQTPEQQRSKPEPAETKPPKGAAATAADSDGSGESDDASADAARGEAAREFSDAPVTQADSLIAAGDCNGALRVLRGAGQNPRAQTKLGAMYLTGTCVPADRVTAYGWFSQAFAADPHNLRLESTRRTIWSQMTDDERSKVESGIRTR